MQDCRFTTGIKFNGPFLRVHINDAVRLTWFRGMDTLLQIRLCPKFEIIYTLYIGGEVDGGCTYIIAATTSVQLTLVSLLSVFDCTCVKGLF